MINRLEEDDDSLDQFAAMFAQSKAAAPQAVERKANRTAAERAAQRPLLRSEQMNFRATPETRAMHNKLAGKLGGSMADVYERAIQELAKREAMATEGNSPCDRYRNGRTATTDDRSVARWHGSSG